MTSKSCRSAREEFVAVTADTTIAHRLQVKRGTPLLLRRRTTVDADGRPIDYAEIYYHTGEISLTLTSRWEPVD
jgi:DNA-binding GntR family transcriptional regulator